jgi:hypothetical protein
LTPGPPKVKGLNAILKEMKIVEGKKHHPLQWSVYEQPKKGVACTPIQVKYRITYG